MYTRGQEGYKVVLVYLFAYQYFVTSYGSKNVVLDKLDLLVSSHLAKILNFYR